jgi:hypothetical protein
MKLAEGVGCDLTLILLGHSQKLVKKFAAEPRIQPLKVQPLIADHSPTTTSPSGFTRGPVCAMIEAIPSFLLPTNRADHFRQSLLRLFATHRASAYFH